MTVARQLVQTREVTLVEILDKLLAGGAVVAGDLTISLAGVDLVYVGLRAILASVDTVAPPGPGRPAELEPVAALRPPPPEPPRLRRLEAEPEGAERGLAQLVLTVVELLRQLMERQALRRVDAGGLDDATIERLGTSLMALESRMEELRDVFGLDEDDLNLDLGPLGRLL